MNIPLRALVRQLVEQGIESLRGDGTLPADLVVPEFVIERPKDRSHGDFSSNVAMLLAKPAKSNPRALAQALVDALPPSDRGHRAGVEYVSANPTGPLHVGHGRAAAIGDCIARVLAANGWSVRREFYYNDAGAQIDNLARSVQARALGRTPDDAGWPEDGYRGDYIVDVAQAYLRGDTVDFEDHAVTGARDPADLDAIRRFRALPEKRQQEGEGQRGVLHRAIRHDRSQVVRGRGFEP